MNGIIYNKMGFLVEWGLCQEWDIIVPSLPFTVCRLHSDLHIHNSNRITDISMSFIKRSTMPMRIATGYLYSPLIVLITSHITLYSFTITCTYYQSHIFVFTITCTYYCHIGSNQRPTRFIPEASPLDHTKPNYGYLIR